MGYEIPHLDLMVGLLMDNSNETLNYSTEVTLSRLQDACTLFERTEAD